MLSTAFCAGQTDRHVFSCNYDLFKTPVYCGFVPNEVFFNSSPLQVCVYATVQFLSFYDIKCSTRNIAKNLNASHGAIRNALCRLCGERLLVKGCHGTYKFINHKLDCSTGVLDANELPSLHYGYWVPFIPVKR